MVSYAFRRTPRTLRRRSSTTPSSRPNSGNTGGPSQDSRAQLVSFASLGGPPVSIPGARNSPRHLLADEFTPPTTPGDTTVRPGSTVPMGYVDANPPSASSPLSYPPAPHPTPSTSYTSSNLPSPSEADDPNAAAEAIAERLRRRTADMELIQFAAQFRGLVHQMQLDVAAGALDTPGSQGTPETDTDATPLSEGEEDYGFPRTTYATPPEGHHTQGSSSSSAQTPDERERMRVILGRLVRRMPTIESLGSREAASTHRGPQSATASRPPTRLTMRSDGASMSSAAPSRSNSLTLGRAVASCASGAGAALPTPPTPVSLDNGYFSAASPVSPRSPSPLGGGPRLATSPSRPPTPVDDTPTGADQSEWRPPPRSRSPPL